MVVYWERGQETRTHGLTRHDSVSVPLAMLVLPPKMLVVLGVLMLVLRVRLSVGVLVGGGGGIVD